MVTQKTVLILGAGASVHLGYPTGEALIEKCINFKPEEWKGSWEGGKWKGGWEGAIEELQSQLKTSPRKSIDACLPNLSGNEINVANKSMWELGKGLIYYFIKEQERETGDRLRSRNKNWYFTLFDQLAEGYKQEITAESKENLKVITFNYDLSFDTFFKEHKLTILHVNGSLEYDYRSSKKVSLLECYRKAKEITTVGEKRPEGIENQRREDKEKTREWIREAKRIFFLGFGFHEENLEHMGFSAELDLSEKEIRGTCYGMTPRVKNETSTRLKKFNMLTNYVSDPNPFGGVYSKKANQERINLSDHDCQSFLENVAWLE